MLTSYPYTNYDHLYMQIFSNVALLEETSLLFSNSWSNKVPNFFLLQIINVFVI